MNKILNNIKNNKILLSYSIIEGFLLMYGIILNSNRSIKNINLSNIILIILFSIVFYILNNLYFKVLSLKYKSNSIYKFNILSLLRNWSLIFILWIPVLLAYYPSIWAYDVFDQVPHLIGGIISNKQPIVHTLFIELFLVIGKHIKNYTFGILLLTMVQMIIMSFIFSYTIEKIKEMIDNKLIRNIISIILIIFYGIVPFNSIMSISITKDVLFSGILLLLIINLYDILENNNVKKFKYIIFIILSILFITLKNSASFAYIILSIFLIIRKQKKLFLLSILSLSVSLLSLFILENLMHVEKVSKFEAYNIQTQNLMYAVVKHPNLDVDMSDKLYELIPRKCFSEELIDDYDKNRADYAKDKIIKCDLKNFNYSKYMYTWFKYGLKYPSDYIDSFSNLTIGSWFLFDESHANTYPGEAQGYLLTDYKIIKGVSDYLPDSKNIWLYEFLEAYVTDNKQYKGNNLLRYIFAPATYILSFFLIYIYFLKNKFQSIPLILLLGLYISILSAPVIIVRYIYPFMITIPFLFVKCISMNNKKEKPTI